MRAILIPPAFRPYEDESEFSTAYHCQQIGVYLGAIGWNVTLFGLEGSRSNKLKVRCIQGSAQPSALSNLPPATNSGLKNIMSEAIGALSSGKADVVINFGHDELPYRLSGAGVMNIIPLMPGTNPDADGAIRSVIREGRASHLGFISTAQARAYGAYGAEALSIPIEVPSRPAESAQSGALFAGRVTREKGIHFATQVSKCSGIHLQVVGATNDDQPISGIIGAPSPIGHLPRNALFDTMRRSGVLLQLQDSRIWSEAFGIVTAEALCCGLPVVTWDCGANTEIVEEEDGIVVPLFNIDAAAEAARIVSSWSIRRRERIRHRAIERFSVDAAGKKLTKWIEMAA